MLMARRHGLHVFGWPAGRVMCLGILLSAPIALATAAGFGSAAAQTAPATGPAPDYARQIEEKRSALTATEQRARDVARSVDALAAEREEINGRLLETARTIQGMETRLTETEGRLAKLEAEEGVARGGLATRHAEIARLLGAMQRMGRNPPPVIFTQRPDALAMVRSAMLLARAFPGLKAKADALANDLAEIERLKREIQSEGERIRTETSRLNEARTRIAGLLESKRQSISERTAELTEIRREAADISRQVTDIAELIARNDRLVEARTQLGTYDRELRTAEAAAAAAAAARPPSPLPDAPAVQPPAPTSPPSAVPPPGRPDGETDVAMLPPAAPKRLKPIVLVPGEQGQLASAARLTPAIPFDRAKAKLPFPAAGRHVLNFGERTQYGSTSKGQVIETRPGAQITSPCDGWIVYAGAFRSYGQLLIINAGGGYHVLLAGLSRINAQVGQFVLASEPIGVMSPVSGPRRSGGSADAQPSVLYVEFRKDNRPIDPSPWWVKGQQKVQG